MQKTLHIFTKKINADSAWLLVYTFTQICLNASIIKYLTSIFSTEEYGIISLFNASLQFFSMIFFASFTQTASTFAFRFQSLNHIFLYLNPQFFRVYGLVVLAVFVFILGSFYLQQFQYLFLSLWLIPIAILESQHEFYKTRLHLLQQRKQIAIAVTLYFGIRLALLIFFVHFSKSLHAVWGAWSISTLLSLFYLKYNFKQAILPENNVQENPSWTEINSFSRWLMLVNTFAWVQVWLDRWLLSGFLSTSETGLYSSYSQLAIHPFSIVSGLLMAKFSPFLYKNVADKSQRPEFIKNVKSLFSIYLLICSIEILFIFLLQDFLLELLLGKAFLEQKELFIWLCFAWMVFQLGHLLSFLLNVLGQAKTLFIPNLITALVSVVANILLIPKFGISGIVIAFILTGITKNLALLSSLYFLRKNTYVG
ncbi:lipopolysaccharide biosynthesis protein [Arcicella lustrica]|uniref:Polysaccharide biosynthesis C-terminal domain-containing protein n=1 Tax=Arcicella lustrica TaxID=2984196 RepID=A0ABU5SI71_9BACT|nr:polysaccharide biosynthesis C-terminal domain-containing protein [Arcicella sp. DC25W]MEA5426936.1 polysaccharide biosynthesis C-terminal domain-containing protein [Arcicella sp. DC25W]